MNRGVLSIVLAVALSSACGQPSTDTQAPKTDPQLVATPGASSAAKAEHVFRGKILQINADGKTLTVDGENVEGWMSAMTMQYQAGNPEVVKTLKVGDQITAKVYDGDFATLHDITVAP